MSMYLPNPDLDPTGVEPAEYLEPPWPGDGPAFEGVARRAGEAMPAADSAPVADTSVAEDGSHRPQDSGRTYPGGRAPARWRRALALRNRR